MASGLPSDKDSKRLEDSLFGSALTRHSKTFVHNGAPLENLDSYDGASSSCSQWSSQRPL